MSEIRVRIPEGVTPTILLAVAQAFALAAREAGAVDSTVPKSTLPVPEVGPTVTLPRTGHVLPMPGEGEGFISYYQRTAPIHGGRPDAAGALAMGGASSLPSQTGVPAIDWPINADAFANPEAYGLADPAGDAAYNARLAAGQATLQPGAIDVRGMSVEELEPLLAELGSHDYARVAAVFDKHGPTKWVHELSALMHASGIRDDGTGHIVPPALFPQLGSLTVLRAQQLAGLA
jgi:hypothetical protein